MVKMMDAVGMEKAVLFAAASTVEWFTEFRKVYSQYPGRFEVWVQLRSHRQRPAGIRAEGDQSA